MTQSRTFKTALLSVSRMLTTVGWLAASMVLARVFTKEDYGTYKQSILVYRFVAPLLLLGLPKAIYYFMPNEPDKRRNILANNMAALGFMAVLFSGFLLLGGNSFLASRFNNPELEKTLLLVALIPLFVLPFQGGNMMACLMVCNRAKLAAGFTAFAQLMPILGVFSTLLIWATPFACVGGYVAGAALMVLPTLWILLRIVKGGRFIPSFSGIWDQLKFAVPLGLAAAAGIISRNLDKVLVSNFFDPEIFAVYTNGAMQLPLIGILTASATAVLLPDMRRMFKEGKYEEGLELWKRAAVKCALILLPMMGFLMVMAPEIMTILYGDKYVASATPFRIYLLLLPIRIAFFGTIFISAGKSNMILIRTVIGLALNIILSIILLKTIGYLGGAIATVIVVYLWGKSYDVFWTKRLLNTNYRMMFPYLKVVKILLAVLGASAFVFWVRALLDINLFPNMILCAFCYGLCVIFLMNFFRLIDIKRALAMVINKMRGCRGHG